MRLAQILTLTGVLILIGSGLHAQTHPYTSYTKADGLPSDYVLRIYQSPGGFMWFGTERGAAMYDGARFTTFTTEDGLPHNMVYDILEDMQGRTWFATPIPRLTYLKHGVIRTFLDSTGSASPLNSLAKDRNHRVFFRFHDGIGILNGDQYRFHPMQLHVSKESRMVPLHDGRLLISDGVHIMASRLDSGTDLRLDTLLRLDTPFTFIALEQAPDSTIYLTPSFRGVTRYRLHHDRLEPIEHIPSDFNTTISALPNNRVVLGSRTTGLKRIERGDTQPLITSPGSTRNFVSSQFVDYEGNLWIGFFGQGVEKITTWNALILNEESGLPERNIWRVATHRGRPLAMSVAGVRRINGNRAESIQGLPSTLRLVRGIQFAGNRVYVATLSDLRVFAYDPVRDVVGKPLKTYDMGDGVNDIRMASDGSLWVATAGLRLFRVMPDETVKSYPMKDGAEKLVRYRNTMWVLTASDGAFRFEGDDFRHYSKANGQLPTDVVLSVHEDEHGILLGTPLGLTTLSPDGTHRQFTASDGLIGPSVIGIFPTQPGSTRSPSYWVITPKQIHRMSDNTLRPGNSLATISSIMAGTHWIEISDDFKQLVLGTSSGLVTYDLTRVGRTIPPPKVDVGGVAIQTDRYPAWMNGDIRHRSASSNLEFDFSGLTFIKESDTRFSYRLVGLDETWSTPQNNRTVRYANVPPGDYEFQVRAINIDGLVSAEVATLRVELTPPWWMHPLVLMMGIVLVAGGLFAAIRWRIQRIRAEIIRRNEQKQFEAIQRIGASISHDIKNTVFSLSLLSKNLEKRFDNPEFRKDAIDTIESSLTYLSTLVNRLQDAPAQTDPLRKEIVLKTLCADIVKRLCNGSGRTVEIDVADSISIRVNPEPIERILENLTRNALEATHPGQRVRIHAETTGQEVVISVMDEGPGMSEDFIRTRLFKPFQTTKSKGLGIGLYSCKELADAMGATLQVDSAPGKGTTFCLRFVSSPP